MYGLALDRGAVVSVPAPTVCVTTIGGDGWLARLPMYTGIAHLAMFFFSLISFINGAVRLCPHNSFLVPRELLCVLLVYRGLGTMFATALTGILFGALTVLLTTLGLFRPIPCWLVMWAVVARVMAAALWHRTYTDPVAPVHSLWTSPEFRALYASRQLLQFSTAAGSEPPAGWPNRVPAPCLVALISAAIAPQKPLPLPPLAPVPDSPRSSAETIPKAGYKRTTASGPYAATTSPHETVVDVATRLSGH
ncbi:hypothetical protein H4R21_004754 [Coemansia helicoidea]|uniref:Uncharacterized protein n=1 Tax=Coemansia helicoidea TaxID=1286919 RepID=A0ACC1KVQ8_9FUNG|nr:hypothetical protein H4R21_004754 [Coemansia helicoidea]